MRHLRSVPPPKMDSTPPSAAQGAIVSGEELTTLLERTNRAFALTIPLLDEPLRCDVGLAYLLLRIADALEDAPAWGRDARMAALDSFGEWLVGDDEEHGWLDSVASSPPTKDAGCLSLLARADAVREAVRERGPDISMPITMDVVRASSQMAEFVGRQNEAGKLLLRDLDDVHDYCYALSGIAGELVTEIFLTRDPSLESEREALMSLAPAFGEGLQLVSILKETAIDAREAGVGLPPDVPRASICELARKALRSAHDYIAALTRGGASHAVCTFCKLPLRLAERTLEALDNGATKLTRHEVMEIVAEVSGAR